MKLSYILGAVAVIILISGLVWHIGQNSGTQQVSTQAQTSVQQAADLNRPRVSDKNVVSYTDSGFSPNILTIKKGDVVTFTNTASDAMRVASNPHPIHNGYPTTGGCVSSTFDSCSDISPGQTWTFKFDIVGKWGFHNHLNPSEGGTIVVQ